MSESSQVKPGEDPRIFFAAERTLLAWLRTGIAIMGLGFLVARFGLFVVSVRDPGAKVPGLTGSTLIGTGFVLLGAFVIGAAAYQQARFARTLSSEHRPNRYSIRFSLLMASFLAVLGAALGGYLLAHMFANS